MNFLSIKDGIAVTLDRRALKTPSGNTLLIPHDKRLVAALIANEWENQDKVIKAHALPVVSPLPSVFCSHSFHRYLEVLCIDELG